MIRRPPRSTQSRSSAASDVYKRQLPGWLGKAVPGAHQLAVVTAVYTVAHQGATVLGDAAPQFDGQIGNAAPGIYRKRRNNGLGRAYVDALYTRTAVLTGWRIDR